MVPGGNLGFNYGLGSSAEDSWLWLSSITECKWVGGLGFRARVESLWFGDWHLRLGVECLG